MGLVYRVKLNKHLKWIRNKVAHLLDGRNIFMIYFIQAEQAKKIKIGFTKKWIAKRMSSMRSESPDSLVFLSGIPGNQLEEKLLHKQFSHIHSHGEWFYECLELVEFINSLLLKNEQCFDILSERLEKGELSVEEANLLTVMIY